MSDNWQIIQYEPEHALRIAEMNKRQEEEWLPAVDIKKWCNACKDGGPAYTMMVDGEPVACAGIILQEWNKADAWALLSILFYHHKIKVYRVMKAGIESLIAERQLRRVQAFIDPRYPSAVDFIECLGFEFEGRLKKWGPQSEDFFIFARTN